MLLRIFRKDECVDIINFDNVTAMESFKLDDNSDNKYYCLKIHTINGAVYVYYDSKEEVDCEIDNILRDYSFKCHFCYLKGEGSRVC